MCELLELLLSFEPVDAIGRDFEIPKLNARNEEAFLVLLKHDFFSAEQRLTLLHKAQRTSCEAIELLLLPQTEDVNSMDADGNYPVHLACMNAKHDILELLLEAGPDVNSRNFDRQCPIHFASESTNINLLVVLIRFGADVNAIDIEG